MADATKIGVADATKMGVANARVANATQPCIFCFIFLVTMSGDHSMLSPLLVALRLAKPYFDIESW